MIELEFSDGRKIWVNCLTVRSLLACHTEGLVDIALMDGTRFSVKGDPSNIANEVHAILRAIRTPGLDA